MAARFERGEPLKKAFARVAAEDIAAIRAALAQEDDRDTAIHRARRAIKRLRALLRLARPALGGGFKKANRRWRDAGRVLAGRRDAAVILGAYDKIAAASADLPSRQASAIRKKLNGGSGNAGKALDPEDGAIRDAIERATRAMRKLRWPRRDHDLFEGLLMTQHRLRQCRKAACADSSSENLHEWRKRLKDDAAQAGLLRSVLPHELAVRRERSKELAEVLGEEHDFALLHTRLAEMTPTRGTKKARDRVLQAIEAKRQELRSAALQHGEALESPPPKTYAHEVARCWASARRDAADSAAGGEA